MENIDFFWEQINFNTKVLHAQSVVFRTLIVSPAEG